MSGGSRDLVRWDTYWYRRLPSHHHTSTFCFVLLVKQMEFQSSMTVLPHSTAPCAIPVMPSAKLGSDKYQFLNHWFHSTRVQTHEVPIRQKCDPLIEAIPYIQHGPRLLEIRSLIPDRVKIVTYQIDTCRFLTWHLEWIGLGKVAEYLVMWPGGILGHGALGLISLWGSTMKLPWVCTVTSWYRSWYDCRCCKDLTLQQSTCL